MWNRNCDQPHTDEQKISRDTRNCGMVYATLMAHHKMKQQQATEIPVRPHISMLVQALSLSKGKWNAAASTSAARIADEKYRNRDPLGIGKVPTLILASATIDATVSDLVQ